MERRKFVKSVGLMTAAAYIAPKVLGNDKANVISSGIEGVPAPVFPALPFAYNALEPYIDARTMEIHYDKHHRAYYTNFINAIKVTSLEGIAEVGIICPMVFIVMNLHSTCIYIRFKSIICKWQSWKYRSRNSFNPGRYYICLIISKYLRSNVGSCSH